MILKSHGPAPTQPKTPVTTRLQGHPVPRTRIHGQCISMIRAILPGKLLIRNLYRLLRQRQCWSDQLTLDAGAIYDLRWWFEWAHNWNGLSITLHPVNHKLTTDTSHTGWGALVKHDQAYGHWNVRMSHASSNYRELLAVLMVLHSFKSMLTNSHTQVVSDNITTVSYLVGQDGPCPLLSDLATAIWAFATEHNIHLSARHLSG